MRATPCSSKELDYVDLLDPHTGTSKAIGSALEADPSEDDSSARAPRSHGPRLLRWLGRIVLALWIPAVAMGVGTLMVGHWSPLPQPAVDDDLRDLAGFQELRQSAASKDNWGLVHFLYADCRCSQAVLEYLTSEDRPDGIDEHVVWIGGDPDDDLPWNNSAMNFVVHRESQSSAEDRFGLNSAPLFVVLDPTGSPQTLSGYTFQRQALAYFDQRALADLQQGKPFEPLPVFGCGVSDSLQSQLDPLGLKY